MKPISLLLVLMICSGTVYGTSSRIACNATDANQTKWTCTPGELLNVSYNETVTCTSVLDLNNNLALGAEVLDCIDARGYVNYCQKLTDGNMNPYTFVGIDTDYVTIDLGVVQSIGKVNFWNVQSRSKGRQYFAVSDDGVNFTDITPIEISKTGDSPWQTGNSYFYTFAPGIEGRYLRIYGSPVSFWFKWSGYEVEVFGYDTECITEIGEVVYTSVNRYDLLRKDLKNTNENVALGKYAWGDGNDVWSITDGDHNTNWDHNSQFDTGNWYGVIFPVTNGNMTVEGVQLPPGTSVILDLENSTPISRVRLDPHTNSPRYSFFHLPLSKVDYYVAVSENARDWVYVAHGTFNGLTETINVPAGITGRFVRTELIPQEYNGFYEVQGLDEIEVNRYVEVPKGGKNK